jgi:hypothetical protein
MAAATSHREHRSPGPLSRIAALAAAPAFAGWLAILIFGCIAYAAFADGAAAIDEESRVQVALAVAVLIAGVGLATGALAVARSGLAWAGAGALALFALLCALSVTWSVAPDLSWIAANRAAEYTALVTIALLAAPSLYRAPEWAVGAFVALTLLVAAYAIGGKVLPEVSIGPIHLDQASQFARLRAPLGYWNALGVLVVMATPACISVAADRGRAHSLRIGGLLALAFLAVTLALTYSRGAVLALVVALTVIVGAGPNRLRRLGVAVLGLLAAVPAVGFAFGSHKLSSDGVAGADRTHEGFLLLAILVGSLLALAAIGLFVLRAEERVRWGPARTRGMWRLVTLLAALALVAGVFSMTTSQRGLSGTVSHQWDEFRKPAGIGNNPGRLISANGSNRWIWWREAAGAFSDKPIAGWGAGSFPIVHDHYREYPTQVRSAHSVPLQFLAENGVIGAVLALGAVGLLFAAAIRTTRASEGRDRDARVVLLAAAAAWGAHCLVDWDWEIPGVTLPALAALAIAAAPWDPSRTWKSMARPRARSGRRLRVTPRGSRLGMPIAVLAGLVGFALALSSALPAVAEDQRLAALSEAADAGTDRAALSDAASKAREAHDLNPLDPDALLGEATIETRLGNRDRAQELLLEAARLQPDNFRIWDALFNFALGTGDTKLAALALQRRVADEPISLSVSPAYTAGIEYALQVPPPLSPTAVGTPPGAPATAAPATP